MSEKNKYCTYTSMVREMITDTGKEQLREWGICYE